MTQGARAIQRQSASMVWQWIASGCVCRRMTERGITTMMNCPFEDQKSTACGTLKIVPPESPTKKSPCFQILRAFCGTCGTVGLSPIPTMRVREKMMRLGGRKNFTPAHMRKNGGKVPQSHVNAKSRTAQGILCAGHLRDIKKKRPTVPRKENQQHGIETIPTGLHCHY